MSDAISFFQVTYICFFPLSRFSFPSKWGQSYCKNDDFFKEYAKVLWKHGVDSSCTRETDRLSLATATVVLNRACQIRLRMIKLEAESKRIYRYSRWKGKFTRIEIMKFEVLLILKLVGFVNSLIEVRMEYQYIINKTQRQSRHAIYTIYRSIWINK